MSDCVQCVKDTISAFGGLDIIVANAGWTRFSDFNDLASMSDDEWTKCWMTNVMGPKKYVEAAMSTFNANPEGGVVIITSSIAGQSLGGSSMPYSVTKAAQIHMMKCVAKSQGPKLRINAVLPGLLLTDWGNKYGDERINMLRDAAALKKEVSLLRGLRDVGWMLMHECGRRLLVIVRICLFRLRRILLLLGRRLLLVSIWQSLRLRKESR